VDDLGQDDIGQDDASHSDEGIDVEELMHNVVPVVLLQRRNKGFDNFETLDKASRDLLYEDCKWCDKKHTVLWMTTELLKLKASNGWSDTSFSDLLQLLTKVLPKPNGLPNSTYLAKNISCPLTLGVEKIHAWPNHCILYQKEHEFKEICSKCNASWYKQNNDDSEGQGRKRKNNATLDQDIQGSKERKVSTLVMWYLPVIGHLKHLFSNPRDAQLLLWHMKRKRDGKIRHPTDGRQWKHFDFNHQEDFSNDPRNIRFGLSTDGMNPFREMRNSHSTWTVIMCIFNLTPWLCHK
jgi:hypothetical protein